MSSLKNLFARRKNRKTQILTKRLRVITLGSPVLRVLLKSFQILRSLLISRKDSTLNLPKVNPIVTESVAVFSKNLLDKLLLTRDIQHAIELIPGANLPDLPHFRLNPTKQIDLKWQVDKL